MTKLELLQGKASAKPMNTKVMPSEEENNALRKIFKGVEELRPELEKNPVSFQGGELLWFCKRGKLSQFQFFKHILIDTSQAWNSDVHLAMRNTFENVYRWIGNNNFVPYSISAEGRLIYDFIVRRLQLETSTTKVVVKATSQRTHLKLVSNS